MNSSLKRSSPTSFYQKRSQSFFHLYWWCIITVFTILCWHYLFSCPTLPAYLDSSSISLSIRQTNTDWLESGGGGWCWAIFTEHLHQLYNVSRRGAVACPLLYPPQYQALLSPPLDSCGTEKFPLSCREIGWPEPLEKAQVFSVLCRNLKACVTNSHLRPHPSLVYWGNLLFDHLLNKCLIPNKNQNRCYKHSFAECMYLRSVIPITTATITFF